MKPAVVRRDAGRRVTRRDAGRHRPRRATRRRRTGRGRHDRRVRRRAPRPPGGAAARARARRRARPRRATCLTFDRHPAEVVRPGVGAEAAHDARAEARAARRDRLPRRARACSPSTRRAASEPAEEFVREVLVDGLGARLVVVGADFHFGYRRHGNVRAARADGRRARLRGARARARRRSRATPSGMPYSSTRDPRAARRGRRRRPRPLLARPPRPTRCAARSSAATSAGRELGFPTANVAVPERDLPARPTASTPGTFVGADGVERAAAISLGRRPTFYERGRRVAARGATSSTSTATSTARRSKVRFVERLRGEERFDSVDALVAQMHRDVEADPARCARLSRRPAGQRRLVGRRRLGW